MNSIIILNSQHLDSDLFGILRDGGSVYAHAPLSSLEPTGRGNRLPLEGAGQRPIDSS